MPQRIIALDVTTAELKAAVLETSFRDYRVVAFHRQAVSAEGGPLADQLRGFLDSNGLAGHTTLSALPGDRVAWRTLSLPFRDRKRLAQTVPFELENHVLFGLDDSIVDYHVLRRDNDGTTVLAALVSKRELEEHLALLRSAGVDPKTVGLAPLAALNVLTLVPGLPPTFAFVDLGATYVTVALYRNGELAGVRTVVPPPAGSAEPRDAEEAAADAAVTRVIGEVRWALLALNGDPLEPDLPCYVAGDSDDIARAQPPLTDVLGMAVRRLDRNVWNNVPLEAAAQAPAFAACLGLGLREVAPTTTMGVEFRRGEFTYHAAQQELRRGLRTVAALAATLVALTVTDLYLEYRAQAVRVENLDAQVRMVFAETLEGVAPIGSPITQLQDEIDVLKQNIDVLNGIVPLASSTSLDILYAISEAIPKSVRVDIDEYTMDADAVRVRGNTENFESVDTMKRQLLGTALFSEVKVNDARATKDGRGVDFRMTLSFTKDFRPHEGRS